MQTVTLDTFVRAETDRYFASFVRGGAFGRIIHRRDLTDVTRQNVVRLNRDTLYSHGVFDLDASPVTVTLPDSGRRFMSLLPISQDHYAQPASYDTTPRRFTREGIGTRYVTLAIRTFVNPHDPADLAEAHALQRAIHMEQASAGTFDIPEWEGASLDATRAAINRMAGFDPSKAFGERDAVDPRAHLIGTARRWGGNPPRDAIYVLREPAANDGSTVHRLTVRDVPVDGFWSVSVYDRDGFFVPNVDDAYSLNSLTAQPHADGSCTIQFGGAGDGINCLPITPGWTYTIRLYRPRPEILHNRWTFPEAQPVG